MRIKTILNNKLIYIIFICVLIDQIIKVIINNYVSSSITIIKNFFYITNAYNYGGAWSILYGKRILFIIITLILIYLIYKIFIKDNKLSNKDNIIYGMLLGGTIGNLLDRIFRGYVIDYLDFYIFGYDYPVFNFADMLIVISVIFIIIKLIRGDKSENRS